MNVKIRIKDMPDWDGEKMVTYDLNKAKGPLYQYLCDCIKEDIQKGNLENNEKLPSKRMLASNLGISTITVENAYNQLIAEGYVYALPKRGYFVADIAEMKTVTAPVRKVLNIKKKQDNEEVLFDFSSNRTERKDFPFSIWAKVMRETISMKEKELLTVSPCEGVEELRVAIANHLAHFRGMDVDPDQIIIGAGTEYLYSLLIKLLGTEKIYCIENPGYKKLLSIYEANQIVCKFGNMDEKGIQIEELENCMADVAHISPTHHFPTGTTMPVSRRYELLAWANAKNGRYIIEDDYDSEFRIKGNPLPTLQSIDACEKVIYMNTFSKSLTSTIRVSYMVLPEHLANIFFQKLEFYANTVSTFEQYTLAEFISRGYFEKHINRMRLHYGRKRTKILERIREVFTEDQCKIVENDSGLHFLLEFHTSISDQEIKSRLREKHIKIGAITDYYMSPSEDKHQFILNYSNLDIEGLEDALLKMKAIIDE